MRYLTMCAAGLGLLAMSATAGAEPATAAGVSRFAAPAPILLAQAELAKKNETVTQKVKRETRHVKRKIKRAWRSLTGYDFDVACPALLPLTHSTCTESGKNRAAARAKCQAKNPLCSVSDAR